MGGECNLVLATASQSILPDLDKRISIDIISKQEIKYRQETKDLQNKAAGKKPKQIKYCQYKKSSQ